MKKETPSVNLSSQGARGVRGFARESMVAFNFVMTTASLSVMPGPAMNFYPIFYQPYLSLVYFIEFMEKYLNHGYSDLRAASAGKF